MKLLREPLYSNPAKIQAAMSLQEMHTCPICGKENDNVVRTRTKVVGYIKRKEYVYLQTSCMYCDAAWESEPYESTFIVGSPLLWTITYLLGITPIYILFHAIHLEVNWTLVVMVSSGAVFAVYCNYYDYKNRKRKQNENL